MAKLFSGNKQNSLQGSLVLGTIKQTTLLISNHSHPIMEEEDDELQSIGNSKYIEEGQMRKMQNTDREKQENFSFKFTFENSSNLQ